MAVVIGLVIIAVVVWFLSRRTPAKSPEPAESPRPTRVVDAAPLTGLESALDHVTDRSGRPIRDRIESTTAIDELKVPEDTGPILRRALDQVEHTHPPTGAESPAGEAAEPPTESAE